MSLSLVVDAILLVLALEAAILIAARRPALNVALALGPGAALLLALRAGLAGEVAIALACLAGSFPLHLADLARRGFLRR